MASDLRPYRHQLSGIVKLMRPATVKKMGALFDDKNNKLLPNQGWVLDPTASVSTEAKEVVEEVKKETKTAPKKTTKTNAAKELLNKE